MDTLGKPKWLSTKKIFMKSLKPSDYFLYKSIRDYFRLDGNDPRGVLVLGCRLIYALAQDERYKAMVIQLAQTLHSENLDYESSRPDYQLLDRLLN